METQTTTQNPPRPTPVKAAARKAAAKPARTTDRIPLKKVCGPLKIDPKTARRILRKQKLAFHDLGNRWDLTDSQAKRVKEALRGYLAE